MPPNQEDYCTVSTAIVRMSSLSSTYFIVSMTFERFYSIIRPHKAASFNTVKRARRIIACIIIFCVVYNIPHLYTTATDGAICGPFGKALKTNIGKFYYFFSLLINLGLPFILLLIMNSIIIQEIRRRPKLSESRKKPVVHLHDQEESEGQGQISKNNKSELQILIILLLVTFAFLVLTTPVYIFFLYINIVDYEATPKIYAGYILFHSVAQKMNQTNFGINFCLYVISGQKFRSDLIKLFVREKISTNSASVSTISCH